MAFEWDRLREFDGSVENAFEELCAQIARIKSEGDGLRFVRNGKPDGGLECFAVAPDGGLVGWQAKWFRSAPTHSQWVQIAESYKTALDTYPSLKRFIVCLPQDRSNSGGRRRLTMEKWNEYCDKWRSEAKKLHRTIDFDYWGTSEIHQQLNVLDQAGRHKYWFDREFLTPTWFRKRFEEAKANNKRRYRPELDVDISVNEVFAPLLQTKTHIDELRRQLSVLQNALVVFCKSTYREKPQAAFTKLAPWVHRIPQIVADLPISAESLVPERELNDLLDAAWLFADSDPHPAKYNATANDLWREHFYGFREVLSELGCQESRICKSRTLLLLGDAGRGKSHTLFRAADRVIQNQMPAVIDFGINFADGDPWCQLLDHLGLKCDREEFLGALNAAGEAKQTRSLVIIDALNESDDPSLWKRTLRGMLEATRDYRFIATAFSVRSEFADEVIPEEMGDEEFPVVQHQGFAGEEAIATAKIFVHFGLATPHIPLLDPEFSNPLLVITLAESLNRAGQHAIPKAARNIRWVFSLWLNVINEQLASRNRLDYDATDNFVQKATHGLAAAMARAGTKHLNESQAKAIIQQCFPSKSWAKSLFRALLDEDVIQRTRMWGSQADRATSVIRFTFDRLADHLIAESLLVDINDADALKKSFAANGSSTQLVVRTRNFKSRVDPGLLLALAIEISEDPRFRCELSDVLTDSSLTDDVSRAMLESVSWRSSASLSPQIVYLFTNKIRQARRAPIAEMRKAIERLITFATLVDHPFNASFLDAELRSDSMSERDFWWSRPLVTLGSSSGVVMRLIDWMGTPAARDADENTSRLCATTAAWLFATSNRAIRDRATTALASMLVNKPALVAQFIGDFLEVDDPYVTERTLAVGYGVMLRCPVIASVQTLANTVYTRCFLDGKLPVHLLARDYARGIVEFGVRCGVLNGVDLKLVRPPYRSAWPTEISTTESWNERTREEGKTAEAGLCAIWYSVSDWGDFGRYVIGTNSGRNDWLRYRLHEQLPSQLLDDSGDKAHRLVIDLSIAAEDAPLQEPELKVRETLDVATPEGPGPRTHTRYGRKFTKTELEQNAWFPLEQIQCMVMDEIIALGYSAKLDAEVTEYTESGRWSMRVGRTAERLGKKYQWIALLRTYAKIADHFRFSGEHNIREDTKYEGPWQINYVRDIDPSCFIRSVASRTEYYKQTCWWAPFAKTGFNCGRNDLDWLKDTTSIPTAQELVEAVEPNSKRWIVGSRWMSLASEKPSGIIPQGWRRRFIWYNTVGVLVKAGESGKLVHWLNRERCVPGQNGHDLLPEEQQLDSTYLGEYPNSPAWDAENRPFYRRSPWVVGHFGSRCPIACSIVSDAYFDDREANLSKDETLQFILPSAELFHDLRLRHSLTDGRFEDENGTLIAWDPSIEHTGPLALLIDPDTLLAYIRNRGLHLVLFVYGAKNAHSEAPHRDDGYLGQLLFSGVFLNNGTMWAGSIDARFEPPRNG